MADLNIIIVGERGTGKSTAARVATQALTAAGFVVELNDKDSISAEQLGLRLADLKGKTIRVSCGNASVRELPDDPRVVWERDESRINDRRLHGIS